MSKNITAVYENGILRPLTPLSLRDGQTVEIQVLSVGSTTDDIKQTLQSLVAAGIVTPPPYRDDVEPVSEEASWELAQRLGQYPGKPLSEIVIEDRGPW